MNSPTLDAGVLLAEARKLYTQKELAALLNKVPRTIARWERGETPIDSNALRVLNNALSRKPSSSSEDFTFIDMFAGIGGIRKGFEAHGGKCVFTSEWDSYSQKTYKANFPNDDHDIFGDITQIDDPASQIPDHDVLLAGFPCQPFSIAGVSKKNSLGLPHGFECSTQGTLFFDVQRIIEAKQPKAFLLENVKNLLSHDKGNTFRVIRAVLEEQLGYDITYKVIDGKHFVPQHRERILIIGFRKDIGFKDALGEGWKNINLPRIEDAPKLSSILHSEDGAEEDVDEGRFIDKNGKIQKKYVLTDKLWAYLQAYAEKHRLAGNGFGFGLVTPSDTARTLSARYYKDGSEILIFRGKGRNPRRLTPRECARLMGFSDAFKIPVSDTRAYKQFGNSVVVPLISHVAAFMKPFIMELKSEESQGNEPRLF
ncbi:DNA (cytosine-5-)-methyltransferase [Ralstonia wenshanensis]|uniref:DNA (cytosine-5-)-methyltransferase n=1 Tax=Ralstonia wenshanensis TaxID=2842456 RepID=UPI0021B3934C|nr:DNA (cytosine-5-)-methyltransferase [Ralstonia wenshanensis]MCT7308430.1 DNA (cytosine-5-)-methyltransferase [Ralstonia wenshanensis]